MDFPLPCGVVLHVVWNNINLGWFRCVLGFFRIPARFRLFRLLGLSPRRIENESKFAFTYLLELIFTIILVKNFVKITITKVISLG
jgi:hypothetical protein